MASCVERPAVYEGGEPDLTKNDFANALRRNLHMWALWRTRLNDNLCEAVVNGSRLRDTESFGRYLVQELHVPYTHPSSNPKTLLAYSAAPHGETSLSRTHYFQFGIPRVRLQVQVGVGPRGPLSSVTDRSELSSTDGESICDTTDVCDDTSMSGNERCTSFDVQRFYEDVETLLAKMKTSSAQHGAASFRPTGAGVRVAGHRAYENVTMLDCGSSASESSSSSSGSSRSPRLQRAGQSTSNTPTSTTRNVAPPTNRLSPVTEQPRLSPSGNKHHVVAAQQRVPPARTESKDIPVPTAGLLQRSSPKSENRTNLVTELQKRLQTTRAEGTDGPSHVPSLQQRSPRQHAHTRL